MIDGLIPVNLSCDLEAAVGNRLVHEMPRVGIFCDVTRNLNILNLTFEVSCSSTVFTALSVKA